MMRKFSVLAFAAVIMFSSCVHQYPETKPADLGLTLSFETDMPHYRTVQFPDETKASSAVALSDGQFVNDHSDHAKYDLRYTIEAYRMLQDGSYAREAIQRWVFIDEDASQTDPYSVQLTLDEGRYLFRVWADYVAEGTSSDLHWLTSDWKGGIKLNHGDGYDGSTDWKDAFVGSVELDVIRYGAIAEIVHGHVTLRRPQGKFFIVTTDLDEFMTKVMETRGDDGTKAPEFDIDDYRMVIVYSNFVPDSYNVHTDRANWSAPTATFETGLKQLDDTRAIMGFDYVITGTEGETSVPLGLVLKDKDGTVLAEHSGVNVPIKARNYTLVEGRFMMQESTGGVAIDPGFNGPDIIVPVN